MATGDPKDALIRKGEWDFANDKPVGAKLMPQDKEQPDCAALVEAKTAIFADIRDRRLLKWIFAEHDDGCGNAIGYVDGPIDPETQNECVETWISLVVAALKPPQPVQDDVERASEILAETVPDLDDDERDMVEYSRAVNAVVTALTAAGRDSGEIVNLVVKIIEDQTPAAAGGVVSHTNTARVALQFAVDAIKKDLPDLLAKQGDSACTDS